MVTKFLPFKVRKRIELFQHSGSKYYCPLCGYHSKDLYPIGHDVTVLKEKKVIGAGRRNAGCYKCGSSDRDRLLYTYLFNKLDILKNKSIKILHFAPERNLTAALKKAGFKNYTCGDLFTEGYKYPEYVQKMNVLNIPFEDNFFDLIICNHLLEHVPNDTGAMKELYRVLATDGTAILQVPLSKESAETLEDFMITEPDERETVFGQFDHVRIYGQDYVERLSLAGFNVSRINISREFPNYGLSLDEDIFIGKKQ